MEAIVLDENFEVSGILDIFESFIWTDRYSECGDFEIYTHVNHDVLELLSLGRYLQIKESEHLMIIETTQINTDIESGNYATINGRSIESILDRRIIWNQFIFKGNLEEAVKDLLFLNVINPSINSRAINNFIFEWSNDPYIESLFIDVQFNGDNLYDVICDICNTFKIGFKVTLNNNKQFVFRLYSGIDRSYAQNIYPYVVFSPRFDNIISSNFMNSIAAYKNVILVADGSEESERKTVVVDIHSKTGLERKEMFTEVSVSTTSDSGKISDDDYYAQMQQKGEEELLKNIYIETFEGQVEPTQVYVYEKDFFMGDILQIENEYGLETRARVTEFIRSESSSGLEVYPTFTSCEDGGAI